MKAANNQERWDIESACLPELTEDYMRAHKMNLGVIRRIAERLRRRTDAFVILMVSPINPRWYELAAGKAFYEQYLAEVRRFADDNGLNFLNLTAEADLSGSDFVDYEGHLGNRDAQLRCTRSLARRISQLRSEMALHR